MAKNLKILGCCLLLGALSTDDVAHGQVMQASYSSPTIDRTTPAMRYFSRGRHASQLQSQAQPQPRARWQPQAMPVVPQTGGKPFQHLSNAPTLSPYLNLDMVQTSEGIPNYYTRVLPQLQQQEAEQREAAEMRRLQQQLRLAAAPGMISNKGVAGVTTTGGTTQFMNRGSYFPTAKR